MPQTPINFDTVRSIGLSLPDVEEGTAYGSPALKLRGKLLTCLPTHRSAEPNSLAVSIEFDKRSVLMASVPETYYFTDHYRNYPIVLVRLSRIGPDELRNLLELAWQFVDAQTRGRGRSARKRGEPRSRK
jgi:hypothetical protein